MFQYDARPSYSRRRYFIAGFAVQVIVIALLIRLGAYTPRLIHPNVRQSVQLVAPSFYPEPPKPTQVIAPRIPEIVRYVEPLEVPSTSETPVPEIARKIEPPKPFPRVATPEPTIATAVPAPAPVTPPKAVVKTDVFAGSLEKKPTVNAPVQKVQTGGFGDENGFRGETTQTAKLNAPKLGSFGSPSGPGSGNGTGGDKGVRGVVASAGFGSGVAGNGTGTTPGGGVHAGGFGDARSATREGPSQPAPTKAAALTPVEVLDKPQPQYTAEARDLKIEGEVHLKVIFQANGKVQVLQVLQGLGHGLDEAAMAAAQKIRFKPAQREGQPCDMTATVHIAFQLAT